MSTYTPIATQTLGGAAATVTFSSLPQNYTDLIVVYNATSSTDDQNYVQFNGDTGSNYSRTFISGNGSSATSSRSSNDTKLYGPFSVSVPTVNIIQVQNYSNGATFKTSLIRSGAANNSTIATVGLWRSTAPITSILIGTNSGTFNSGTVFTIYGVAAGNSSAKASGGNIVTTDGSYWYHTFTSSGTFIPSQALTVDYLVVAGGGGGGNGYSGVNNGGGGGAGGFKTSVGGSTLSLSSNTVYQAIIGAGGIAGTNGNNSIFSTITSTGGGAGGQNLSGAIGNGSNGGSGGGGTAAGGGAGTGGTGNAGEGYAGGAGQSSGGYYAGGGGGAGEVGNTDGAGYGGDGLSSSLSGTSITYAGGGSGSTNSSTVPGGDGGGGTGGSLGGVGTAATVNTGGGGGGGSGAAGGNGGSGIIIVRYAV